MEMEVVGSEGFQVDLSQAAWRKSSASGPFSDNCVEVAPVTVEVGAGAHSSWIRAASGCETVTGVAVRDSKHPDGSVLLFTPGEWDAFVGGAKDGEFDL